MSIVPEVPRWASGITAIQVTVVGSGSWIPQVPAAHPEVFQKTAVFRYHGVEPLWN